MMNKRVRIPIRVESSAEAPEQEQIQTKEAPAVVEADPPVVERKPVRTAPPEDIAPQSSLQASVKRQPGQEPETEEETPEVWRDRALRLQAEMENFRKRQRRLAEAHVREDRSRLLQNLLSVADNLERALDTNGTDKEALREGVAMTHRSLMKLLSQEGVEPIEAEGKSFNPNWHEAVGAVSHKSAGVEPNTVIEVTQPGYRLGEQLLRPAQVIVAT